MRRFVYMYGVTLCTSEKWRNSQLFSLSLSPRQHSLHPSWFSNCMQKAVMSVRLSWDLIQKNSDINYFVNVNKKEKLEKVQPEEKRTLCGHVFQARTHRTSIWDLTCLRHTPLPPALPVHPRYSVASLPGFFEGAGRRCPERSLTFRSGSCRIPE